MSEMDQQVLRAMCGTALPSQLRCPDCSEEAINARKYQEESHPWAVLLYCSCSSQWVICKECPRLRTRMQRPDKISFHAWSKHNRKKPQGGSVSSPPRKMQRRGEEGVRSPSSDASTQVVFADMEAFSEPETEEQAVTMEDDSDDDWFFFDGLNITTTSEQEANREVATNKDVLLLCEDAEQDGEDGNKKPQSAMSGVSNFSQTFFGSSQSSEYFWHENCTRRGGLSSIVSRCEFDGMTDMAANISTADVQYITETARFCHTLTRGQRQQFAHILKMTVSKTLADNSRNGRERPWKVAIPDTVLELRQCITEYPMSFLKLLPTPRVQRIGSVGSHFAYVSLKEIVQNFLAFGHDLVEISTNHTGKVSRIVDSAHCQRRYKEIQDTYSGEVLVLWIVEWSDGYDPHSFSKANRGSAWTKVISFVSPEYKSNAVEYTYPMALGLASGNHDVVEERFRQELLVLSSNLNETKNMFYSATHKRFIQVHVELLVSLMDQPERRSAMSLQRGNSNNCARWGYSVKIQDIQKSLVPCVDCQDALLAGSKDWDREACVSCTQWKIPDNCSALAWGRPDNFPLNECTSDSGMLLPIRLTFDKLKDAMKKTQDRIVDGTWSKSQAEEYLTYFGLQSKLVNDIITSSENIRLLEMANANQETNPLQYADVMDMVLDDPDSFAPVEYPPLWNRGVALHQHIDVLMHLVFLGAVDGTIKFIHGWLKGHSKYASFMRLALPRLNVIRRLNLKWCKAMPYKGNKLGGWVSENYLAFARVCKWFVLILDGLGRDEEEYTEPNKPYDKWTAKENKKWLQMRGLSAKGKAAELRARVAELRTQEGGPPPLLAPPGGTIDDVFDLVSAMYDMVKSVMVTSCGEEEVHEADRCIKLFLTLLVKLERNMNTGGKKKSKWISSYTFPCLLNLPDTMKEFGPLRNFWEGRVKGEGILKFMKPEHGTIGLRIEWEIMVLIRVLQKKMLAAIAGGTLPLDWQDDAAPDDKEEDEHSYANREFFKYPGISHAMKDFDDNVPLSVIETSCARFGIVTRNDSILLLQKVEPARTISLHGMLFVNFKIEQQFIPPNERMPDMTLQSVGVSNAYLFLPHPTQKHYYYGVRSDWSEMTV